MKRILSFILAAILCIGNMSLTTLAADGDVPINPVNFPDDIFRNIVSEKFDTNKDDILSKEERRAVDSLSVNNKGIKTLTGIEHFTLLKSLYCGDNGLTSLAISKNALLNYLYCSNNQLTILNVSNKKLETLYCENNNLTSLDVVYTYLDGGYSNSDYGFLTGVINNEYTIQVDENRQFDLSTLPEGFNVNKTRDWNGGTVNGNVLTVDKEATKVTYTYLCGQSYATAYTLKATFTLLVEEPTIPPAHSHSYSDWSKDDTDHWQMCIDISCPDKDSSLINVNNHNYYDEHDTTCDTCGYVRTIEVPHVHNDMTFLPWDGTTVLEQGKSYYLTQDLTASITKGLNTNLCLNGHNIKGSGNSTVLSVGSGSTLNLYDCKGTGQITGGYSEYGGGVRVSGTFNMYGGNITGNKADYGAAVYLTEGTSSGKFNMYGGTISNNTTRYGGTGYGLAVYSLGYSMKIFGGTICDHENTSGSLIEIKSGSYGGCQIAGNAVIANNKVGHIVYVGYDRAVPFSIYGNAKITNNTGSIVNYCGSINISENAVFSDNVGGITGYENVYIGGNAVISNSGGISASVDVTIADNASIINNSSHRNIIFAAYDLTITGGTICGNTVTTESSSIQGAVAAKETYSAADSTITISGKPVIINNTVNGVEKNLYLTPEQLFIGESGLIEGAKIGVTLSTVTGNVTTESDLITSEYAGKTGYIMSDDSNYITALDGKKIVITEYVATHTHNYATLNSDTDSHWYECSCGEKSSEATHSGGTATCTEKAKCSTCGTEYGSTLDHTYGADWKNDSTNHWHECSCGAKSAITAHIPGTAATETTAQICTECGYEIVPALGHTHNYATLNSDTDSHWYECSCGEKSSEATHSGGTATCTEKAKCSTCGTEYGSTLDHTYGSDWKNDSTNHWHECSCGAKSEVEAHSYDNNQDSTCNTCGYVRTIIPPAHTHNWATTYSKDSNGHWFACSGCDGEKDYVRHSYTNGICVCGQKDPFYNNIVSNNNSSYVDEDSTDVNVHVKFKGVDKEDIGSLKINLLKDGKKHKSAELSAKKNWKVEWEDLNDKYDWTIELAKDLKGYNIDVDNLRGNYWVITISKAADVTNGKANPETGASDFVGMAVAMAVISVAGATILTHKKR